jgi:nifR3 family TIM-barrel protein
MRIHEEVSDALGSGRPVVALESTIISHGLPRPRNLQVAREIEAAVRSAGAVPVTVKMRIGLDEERVTFLEAGRLAADAGAAAVALHARTAEQRYSGRARWSAIAELVEALPGTPVLGNGDIWTADDALEMVDRTGCAGVVVGRACLGRPWFFGQLADAFAGRPVRPEPPLGEVAAIAADHARLLVEAIDEDRGLRMMRKHLAWYLTGFPVGPVARKRLTSVSTLGDLDAALADLDPTLRITDDAARQPRGTQTGPHAVVVPDGWLDADAVAPPDALADASVSGG